MNNVPIYTIGYGGRSKEDFVRLLKHYKIAYLVDARSHPYSRFNEDFSQSSIEKYLRQNNIQYIFMGDTLGGRPKDASCYEDGRVDYAKLREKPFYQNGIERLRTAWEKQLRVVVMCTEIKPQECHRAKLIGNTLTEQHIAVAHIDEKGDVKEQDEVNQLILSHLSGQLSLFDADEKMGYSRKKYVVSGG